MSDKIYVWELKEAVDYEGNLWSILIKDDEKALEKVKGLVLEHLAETLNDGERYLSYLLDNGCDKSRVERANGSLEVLMEDIKYVSDLKDIGDYKDIKNGVYTIELDKIEVI